MFQLDEVVPWGRSFEEYRRMFAVSDADLERRILACADGPASFNAEATRLGGHVVSCDPIYGMETDQIRDRIAATYERVLEQTRQNAGEFVWGGAIGSVDELGAVRLAAMEAFLDDFDKGKAEGRYVEAVLPTLPFADGTFDLALCSHFLFLYGSHLNGAFHLASVLEMCRVAGETRVFPLLALGGRRSEHVASVAASLSGLGYRVDIEAVPYEFQRGGHEMMRICRRSDLT